MKLDRKKLKMILTVIAVIIVAVYVLKDMKQEGGSGTEFETIGTEEETTQAADAETAEESTAEDTTAEERTSEEAVSEEETRTSEEEEETSEETSEETYAAEESVTEAHIAEETEPETEKSSKNKKKEETKATTTAAEETPGISVKEGKSYTDRDHVALYIHQFGELPPNFITKKEAEAEGWDSSYNYVGEVAPGCSIGGDRFGNYEGQLPKKKGRTYYECDIDYKGKKRNAKRIVFSDDGLVYYTEDHYASFELLYGEE